MQIDRVSLAPRGMDRVEVEVHVRFSTQHPLSNHGFQQKARASAEIILKFFYLFNFCLPSAAFLLCHVLQILRRFQKRSI